MDENYSDENMSISASEGVSRRFLLSEIRTATNNFDKLLVIGRGGFGFVYRGIMDSGVNTVAIKRLNSKSKQGANEFWTEIDMLSKLRHTHLVSLIGYCDEDGEMILVYEYMEHGTLADHLYKIRTNGGDNLDLSWEQKLKICIGAACGLDYLHTGTPHGVIHRDVKTTNILLDNKLVAKISDFGLCKVGPTSHSYTHVSTNVKGTFGYFDPEYFFTHRLTKKSDVYAFGVVLLEVLCERPAVDISLSEDRHSLALWARQCIKEGNINELIGPSLRNQISSSCLKIFTEIAFKCLDKRPIGRPTMSDVVVSLQGALISQNRYGDVVSEHNEEERVKNDESDNYHLPDTVKLNGPIPSPTTSEDESHNNNCSDGNDPPFVNEFLPNGSLEDYLFGRISQNHNVETVSEQNGEEGVKNNESDSYHLPDTVKRIDIVQLDGALQQGTIPSSTTHVRDVENILQKRKRSKGILVHAFQWSLRLLIKRSSGSNSDDENNNHHLPYRRSGSNSDDENNNHHLPYRLSGSNSNTKNLMLVNNYMVNKSIKIYDRSEVDIDDRLPWTMLLGICIGKAKELQYLHYGTTEKSIHRDIKPTNILLDENYIAKTSGFELSKVAVLDHTSKFVRRTTGLLGPEYASIEELTGKTDVHAFGVALLEFVCACKPYEEKHLLIHRFRISIRQKTINQFIDPCFIGRISPECLIQYLKVTWNCLLDQANKRPTMNSVVQDLQIALQLQQIWNKDSLHTDRISPGNGRGYNDILASYSRAYNDKLGSQHSSFL